MYLEYWGLTEKPFENTSDPRFFYLSAQHQEAYSRLMYAIQERKAAAMISGIFGCGKTVLASRLTADLSRNEFTAAYIFNPLVSHVELLSEIIYQLGKKETLPLQKSLILHKIQEMLIHNYEDGKHTIIMIDEAHLIEDGIIFEELRLLLNLVHQNKFLLTLLLFGQPELREKVFNLKALEQRITIRYHLSGLKIEETKPYVIHRLQVSGVSRAIFREDSFPSLFHCFGGIPRRINQVCDLALLVGMGKGLKEINQETIEEVASEFQLQP